MRYTIVDHKPGLELRAEISTREDIDQLIAILNTHRDKFGDEDDGNTVGNPIKPAGGGQARAEAAPAKEAARSQA